MFLFVGRSALVPLAHHVQGLRDPIYYPAEDISDHIPPFWKSSTVRSQGQDPMSAAQLVQGSCLQKKSMEALWNTADLSSLPVDLWSIRFKACIREASIHARDSMSEDPLNGHTSKLLRYCRGCVAEGCTVMESIG